MAIIIKEYLGYEYLNDLNKTNELNLNEYTNSDFITIAENSIMVDIEGIHEYPFCTRNYTRYMKEALVNSVPTWTKPYLKPLIMHHNDKDGKIIGRIYNTEYTNKNTSYGNGALVFTVNVPDKDGKEQIQDGRLMTTSIGVSATDVRCSICGANIAEGEECEHERGRLYDGEICYWDIYEMEGKELSYVIVPSDIYSKNKKIYKPNVKSLKESEKGVFDLKENEKIENKESKKIDEVIPDDKKNEDDNKTVKEPKQDKNKKEDVEDENAQEATDEKQKLADALTTIQKELDDTKKELKKVIKDLETEKNLRETLENEIMQNKKQIRESLENEFNVLRKTSGKKELSEDELSARSNESISDSIKDLKEELESINSDNKIDLSEMKKVESPVLEEEEFDNETKIKEDKDDEVIDTNIDLSEEVEKIFSDIVGARTL